MIIDHPEGATLLDPDEMEGLKFRHITTRSELDHLEQANIQSGMEWMRKSKRTDLLTESYVCDLHKKLFGEVWNWAGTFRRAGKNIGVDPVQIAVELRMLLDDMRYWATHETYPPLEAAIRFHHRLVFIHPFPNGNGRHARIMADALLLKLYRDKPIDWAGGHDLGSMNERRKEYIQALRAADRGDYAPLFAFAGIVGSL
ncbi:MAG: mobile mystery protein B [Rhodospirillales bacterium]|nr:mobile mystery protein B [Alphaproteobacteria bacterium]MCB9976624.1 mobile mystery protein B [Rhodospirillales bacterium]